MTSGLLVDFSTMNMRLPGVFNPKLKDFQGFISIPLGLPVDFNHEFRVTWSISIMTLGLSGVSYP